MVHTTALTQIILQALLISAACADFSAADADADVDTGAILLSHRKYLISESPPVLEEGKQVCAELKNRGTYFSVDVEVGTPGQRFSVVADTGSNTLIVPSCICQQAGYCRTKDRCFTGTNKSSTFELVKGAQDKPVSLVLTFGSGMIRGVLARERVTVGGLEANMKKGIMLMTGKALNFGGSFEGILGLGIPKKEEKLVRQNQQYGSGAGDQIIDGKEIVDKEKMQKIIDWLKKEMKKKSEEKAAKEKVAEIQALVETSELTWEDGQQIPGMDVPQSPPPPGFLEQAGITRFGICFNEGKSGVLRFGMPTDDAVPAHSSIGKEHWGVGLNGISLAGSKPVHLKVCSAKDMIPGQDTPCGAIPDSGTTMITGPAEGVRVLLDSICDNWDRCKQNHTALAQAADVAEEAARKSYGINPFDLKPWPKYKVLEFLMLDCESWITDADGLGELPTLQFHVTGGNGTRQTLELPGHYYVMERSIKELRTNVSSQSAHKDATDTAEEAFINATSGRTKVCIPAFGVLDYNTAKNGPVWILGSPFFYAFNVGYDLGTEPPSLSLAPTKKTPCGSCNTKAGLVTEDAEVHSGGAVSARQRRPLPVEGELRHPDYDVSRPL